MPVKRAETLACPCGGDSFISLSSLIQHPGQGITQKAVGYRCSQCNEMLNMDRQTKLSALRRRQEELREVEQEIAEMETKNS